MYALLMTLFIVVTIFLAIFVLIQQGKGDLGLSALGGGTQMLFGGSGGKSFFEKVTWVLGAVFILGALGLAVLKSRVVRNSRASGYISKKKQQTPTTEMPLDFDQSTQDNTQNESNAPVMPIE